MVSFIKLIGDAKILYFNTPKKISMGDSGLCHNLSLISNPIILNMLKDNSIARSVDKLDCQYIDKKIIVRNIIVFYHDLLSVDEVADQLQRFTLSVV